MVVTGVGVVSPLGVQADHTWQRMLNGDCGVVRLDEEEFGALRVPIAARVPKGEGPHQFNTAAVVSKEHNRTRGPDYIAFAMAAAAEALASSGLLESGVDKDRVVCLRSHGMVCNRNTRLTVRRMHHIRAWRLDPASAALKRLRR